MISILRFPISETALKVQFPYWPPCWLPCWATIKATAFASYFLKHTCNLKYMVKGRIGFDSINGFDMDMSDTDKGWRKLKEEGPIL